MFLSAPWVSHRAAAAPLGVDHQCGMPGRRVRPTHLWYTESGYFGWMLGFFLA